MSLDPSIVTNAGIEHADVHRLAAAARSILACPDDVHLTVDGIDDPQSTLAGDTAHLEMQDAGGQPRFSCPADAPLALAANERRGAVLTLTSGLGSPGSADRDAALTLSGRLEATGLERCSCCDDTRAQIRLHLDFAALVHTSRPHQARVRVPLAAFSSPAHDLNRGFLQRAVEHANHCHQGELRRAIATRTGTPLAAVVGVHLAELRRDGVVLQWVDITGAHQADLAFGRSAHTTHDLGDLLRSELHAGLC